MRWLKRIYVYTWSDERWCIYYIIFVAFSCVWAVDGRALTRLNNDTIIIIIIIKVAAEVALVQQFNYVWNANGQCEMVFSVFIPIDENCTYPHARAHTYTQADTLNIYYKFTCRSLCARRVQTITMQCSMFMLIPYDIYYRLHTTLAGRLLELILLFISLFVVVCAFRSSLVHSFSRQPLTSSFGIAQLQLVHFAFVESVKWRIAEPTTRKKLTRIIHFVSFGVFVEVLIITIIIIWATECISAGTQTSNMLKCIIGNLSSSCMSRMMMHKMELWHSPNSW